MVANHPQQLVTIQRPVYEQEQLHEDFEYHKCKSSGKCFYCVIVLKKKTCYLVLQ